MITRSRPSRSRIVPGRRMPRTGSSRRRRAWAPWARRRPTWRTRVLTVLQPDRATGSIRAVASSASILSVASLASIGSVGSVGSFLSVGSAGSILSIGSAGSILSIGSAGSVLCVGGFGVVRRSSHPHPCAPTDEHDDASETDAPASVSRFVAPGATLLAAAGLAAAVLGH